MAWKYRFVSSGSLETALKELESSLDGIKSPAAQFAAKIAIGDQKDASAKGLVLWNEDIKETPLKPEGDTIAWARQTYNTNDGDTYRDAGKEITAKLNELSSNQAFWAKLVIADAKYMGGQTVLFYPTNA